MTRLLKKYFLPAAFASTCLYPAGLVAQVDRAALSGTILDTQGAALSGAHVVAHQEGTGLVRDTVASADGHFAITGLPIGRYSVSLFHAGFETANYEDVLETAGHTTNLAATMKVASKGVEQVVVSGAVQQEDRTSSELGASVSKPQVEQLPLNGRNWSTLTALVPGAIDTGGSNQRSLRFAGRGLDDNNFTYDGIDAINVVNQAQQPFVRLAIPTESIAEFHVSTMLFTADNGSTPGGQVSVVSGTGSNALHASAFEYLRNSALDAREPIDTLNTHKPPFRLNQFGGSVAGPIAKDRTFYFGTYEGLRQNLGQTLPGFVPSAAFRAAAAQQSPVLAALLTAYPNGTIPISSTVDEFVGQGDQRDQENSVMLRVDHRFRAQDTAYLRFNYDAAISDAPLASGGAYLLDRQQIASRPVNGIIQHLHIFSNSLLNEAKFGFNRGNVYTTNQNLNGTPYAVSVSGFTTLASNQYKLGVGNTFSFVDTLTMVRGAHTFRTGMEVRRIQLNQGNTATGTITYSSPAHFLDNVVSSASYAAELPVNGLRKTFVFAFAQDEWKLRNNLTLNLGLRYSFYNRFHEVLGRAIPFDFATCGAGGFCGAGASFGRLNLLDFDPRVAIIYAPAALGGKTVLRSGFGIYHGDGQLDDQNLPINNEVGRYSLSAKTIPNLSYPITPFLASQTGIVSPRDMDRRRKDMYVSQWGASIERPLGHDVLGTVSYLGSKGTDLLTTSYINLINPLTGTRQYAGFNQVEYRGNINNSSFNALVVSASRLFASGLTMQANWMYSHEIDQDSAGGGDSDFPQNPACLSCERASGDFDVRHTVNANAVYSLPYGRQRNYRGGPAPVRAVFGDWDITSIVTARTGLPVNITIDRSSSQVATGYTTNQRPDRVAGVPLYPASGSGIANWINPAAFAAPAGLYGTLGRNALHGPGLWQADLGLAKQIPLTEQARLAFRAEFFNIFNRAQYGQPLGDFTGSGFGAIIAPVNTGPVGTGTPRQIQLSLRASF